MWFEVKRSHFPILIELTDDHSRLVINHPSEIPSGVSFKVIKTNYKK